MARTIKSRLATKLQNNAFTLSLSIGSLIGFIINTYLWFAQGVTSFQWLSVILGLGLLFEGKIQYLLDGKKSTKISVSKLITISVGAVVLIGGLFTLPFLSGILTDKLIGAIGISNIVAVIVIGAEIFIID